ncbi:glycosyltransferase family 4 protein [Viridibacillus sp. FSL E2-0187]|uniref:glycosyltransferase family 4 protein n=1 Tax=Viridibacillus sp. FSL E2-0187 TaxID=2921362 RepID=UPI0030FCFCD4
MKIVQIVTKLDTVGGAQSHVLSLTKQLCLDGHEVIIMTSQGQLIEEAKNEKSAKIIQLRHLRRNISMMNDYRAFLELRFYLQQIGPELVALHSSKAGVLGRLAAFSLKIPTVFTAHGWAFTEGVQPLKKLLYKHIEKILAPRTTKIIAVSNYDQELAVQKKVVSKNKITTIHNGIQSNDKQSHFHNNVPKIVMVSRFEKPKRQDLLIEVLSTMKELEWSLELIGDGVELANVKDLVKHKGLSHRVRFLGVRNDIENQVQDADIFVLLSNFEGLPISILEAMRAGLPVIASDVGGVAELVIEGKTGYLVDQNVLKIRKCLVRMIEDRPLRIELGQAGRNFFEDHFLFQKMYDNTVSLYKEALIEKKVKRNVQLLDHNRA